MIEDLADWIAQHRLTQVALLLLESSKPLSFVASQLLVFTQPVAACAGLRLDSWIYVLEDRSRLEQLLCLLDQRIGAQTQEQ